MIYIITVIVSLIFFLNLIKVKIDEWFNDLSMKRSRLSLNRAPCNATNVAEIIDLTDDDSPNPQRNLQPSTSSQQRVHDLHVGSDDDVIIDELPKICNRSPSMFNWNKTIGTNLFNKWPQNNFLENNIPHVQKGSKFNEQPGEARNKRQKLINNNVMNDTSSNDDDDDDFIDWKDCPRKDSPPKVTIQYEKLIDTIKVKFPVNPYRCQIAIASSVIRGCKKKQNCLLESPTGSGKTLALLCSVLAWHEQYSEEIRKENDEIWDIEESSGCDDSLEILGDDFFFNPSQCCKEESDDQVLNKKPRKVPKIYYGSRTHKQIEQVVGELKKTAYKDKRMTILSSREKTCIQNSKRNKTELCNELLDPKKSKKCPYFNERNKKAISTFAALENQGLQTPWDIEDLISLGRRNAACPYFAARSLMAEAEIIFCPYNYIVDPSIRQSMQINLKDSIVILDEAHNIEDICREIVSVNFRDDNLSVAAKECEKVSNEQKVDRNIYTTIQNYLADVVEFLKFIKVENNGRELDSEYWPGSEFLCMLDMNKVGRSRFQDFENASRAAILHFEKMKEEVCPEKMFPTISFETKKILEHLCFIMEIFMSNDTVDDYKVHVIQTMEPVKNVVQSGEWTSTSTSNKHKVRTMKLICMNPAIVFAPLARTARSVILASGTLTPMSSFQSELGTKFPNKPSLMHIISKEQVYVRCISHGPNKKPLLAKFNKVHTLDFQDELGALVLQVCNAVPYGVLCFFSSYYVMNKILERWQNNTVWQELKKLKRIFEEPQGTSDISSLMREYRQVIRESSSISFREPSGAIFFVVFRGKIAEGIDFKDNEARCVLTVGIPYMYKNGAVSMKMKYNDSNRSKGLLEGSEWYSVNAFRALNQALGRCIRHKDDWGAVLLVDERFQNRPDYLPKWIKDMFKETYNNLRIDLEDFVAQQIARGKEKKYIEDKKKCNDAKD